MACVSSTWNHKCLIRADCHPELSEGPFLRPQSPLAALGVTAMVHRPRIVESISVVS